MELIAEHAHEHQVVVGPVAPHVLAQPPLLDEAAGAIGAAAALVAAVDAQEDAPQIEQPEGVVEQQANGFPAIAPPPIRLVANDNAQFGRAANGSTSRRPMAPMTRPSVSMAKLTPSLLPSRPPLAASRSKSAAARAIDCGQGGSPPPASSTSMSLLKARKRGTSSRSMARRVTRSPRIMGSPE